MRMDTPDDLGQFQTRLFAHFSQYYRCAYNVTRIRSSIFFKTVTHEMLQKRIILHSQALNHDQFLSFVASQSTVDFSPDEPGFKIWLIPSQENGKTFLFMKAHHGLLDGMSTMQMFSAF